MIETESFHRDPSAAASAALYEAEDRVIRRVAGAFGDLFWFYTSFRHRQWGIFIASVFYGLAWAIGVYRNF